MEISKQERMKELASEINKHNHRYYMENAPTISDKEYDLLLDELMTLENETGVVLPNSPSHRVGSNPISEFKKVKHRKKLLSLAKCRTVEEIEDWVQRNQKLVSHDFEFSVEYKFDGLAMAIQYNNGNFVRATTRGDGTTGEDVSEQIKTIRSVPLQIPFKGFLEMQGEAIMRLSVLNKINKTSTEPLKNARNAAAGAVRNLNPKVTASRKLDLMAYSVNYVEGVNFKTQKEENNFLKENGFQVSDYFVIANSIEEIKKQIKHIDEIKNKLDFLIDGMVFKINNLAVREELGYTDRFPRGMMAYKFEAEETRSVLKDVVWQVGRTGKLTPIAVLEPTELAGVTVSRATLNNYGDILRKNAKINSYVFIRRSNEVIPEVLGLAEEQSDSYLPPKPMVCPVCGTELRETEANLICPNHSGCRAQIVGRLEHFVSRNAMNIDGLSEKTIEKMVDELGFKTYADLYKLTATDISKLEGFKEKSVENLITEIHKSKSAELDRFIHALGIDGVGKKMSRDLAKKFGTLENIINANCGELDSMRDIAELSAQKIVEFFNNQNNLELIEQAKSHGVVIKPFESQRKSNDYFTGQMCVLTGSLEHFKREEATKIIEENGGEVMSSVSKNTTLVIAGENAGSKLDKAQKLGIKVVSEDEFVLMIKNLSK